MNNNSYFAYNYNEFKYPYKYKFVVKTFLGMKEVGAIDRVVRTLRFSSPIAVKLCELINTITGFYVNVYGVNRICENSTF